ncbi:sensor histidine kinase [Flavobacterium beibuense]|uniref:sensor histidine kinase n=1 Tax=Flavobacterium beibuense TaxID=657326 RepID=UPI00068B64B1|nr:sensor histidine kinase [Flavobacterium beibuense]
MSPNTNKYLTYKIIARIIVLVLFGLIFKSFDLSFIKDNPDYNTRSLVFVTMYVIVGFLIWEGAIRIAKFTERKLSQSGNRKKLIVLCSVFLLYGVIAAFAFGFIYAVTDIFFFNRYEAWDSFTLPSYDLIFGSFLFYFLILAFNGIIFYYRQWRENLLHTERLMRENTEAKYEALRNQIDPHFFFNSLSVLTNLVYKDPDIAADYITQLAKTYRYILDKKFENMVILETELNFLESYLFLINIRHQNSINIEIDLDDDIIKKCLIAPATLQMLFENAIKHTRFSLTSPLFISLKRENNWLIVKNNLCKKQNSEASSGLGLENIKKRYELIGNNSIIICETNDSFIVKIPVILPL